MAPVPCVQLATPVAGVVTVSQEVVTQLLPELAVMGVHVATPVGPVVATLQTTVGVLLHDAVPVAEVQPHRVAVHWLVELAATGVQPPGALTAEVVVVTQLVATQLLPEAADTGVHEATGVGPVLTGRQLVLVQEFPKIAAADVQEATPA